MNSLVIEQMLKSSQRASAAGYDIVAEQLRRRALSIAEKCEAKGAKRGG